MATLALVTAAVSQAATPPPASAFGSRPDFSFVALSPDGRTIAMDAVGPQGMRVVLFRPGDSKPLRILEVDPSMKLRGLDWANAETALIDVSSTLRFTRQTAARSTWEFGRTMAARIDASPVRILLLDDGRRRLTTGSSVLALNPSSPDLITMASWNFSATHWRNPGGTRLSDERADSGWVSTLFEVELSTGRGRATEHGTAFTRGWLVDGDGRVLARSEWKAEEREQTILVKSDAGWKAIQRQTGRDWLDLDGVTIDGKAIVAVGANGGDRSRAWALPLDGSAPSVLFEVPDGDVTSAIRDRYTGRIVGFTTGGLEARQHWVDSAHAAQQRALNKAFPGRDVYMADRTPNGTHAIVVVESASHPPAHYLIDFGSAKADLLGEAYPGLAGATLGSVRSISFNARDGATIPAYLTLPPDRGEKNLPLVVLPHGGPEARDDGGFDWWAQFLATRGYAVLQPQFRGSTGFGEQHRLAGYRQWGGLMQDDVTDGVRHLIEIGLADPKRICIVGASYGGYSALAGAAFTPELYACAISVNGVSDLPQMIVDVERRGGDSSDELAYWKDHIGSPIDPKVAQRSPARAAASIRAPILLIHGDQDTVVPPRQSELMASALADAGKPYEYVTLPGEDHWLSRAATRVRMLESVEAFLAKHL